MKKTSIIDSGDQLSTDPSVKPSRSDKIAFLSLAVILAAAFVRGISA